MCIEVLFGVGGVIACGIAIWYDTFLERAKERNASWPKSEEYRRLPLACISRPLDILSLFWLVRLPRPPGDDLELI